MSKYAALTPRLVQPRTIDGRPGFEAHYFKADNPDTWDQVGAPLGVDEIHAFFRTNPALKAITPTTSDERR